MPNLLNQTILLTPLQIIYVMKVRVKRRENERRKQRKTPTTKLPYVLLKIYKKERDRQE